MSSLGEERAALLHIGQNDRDWIPRYFDVRHSFRRNRCGGRWSSTGTTISDVGRTRFVPLLAGLVVVGAEAGSGVDTAGTGVQGDIARPAAAGDALAV